MPTFYINADTGDDVGGDGSEGNPWETLSQAHDQAADGDTIVCQDAAATYAFVNQTFAKSLTVQGEQEDASGAVFDGGNAARMWQFGVPLTLEKITIQNCLTGTSSYLLRVDNGTSLSLTNCVFKGVGINGNNSGIVEISGETGAAVTMTNCLIYDVTADADYFIGCIFRVDNATDPTWTMTGCTLHASDTDIDGIFGVVAGTGTSVVLKNCIFQHDSSLAFEQSTGWDSKTATYCCFNNITGSPSGTGVITSDPLFVDSANDNFSLRPDSPCINTGTLV